MTEANLTESMLNNEYHKNGLTFKKIEDAQLCLKSKGYRMQEGIYKDRVGRRAFLYPLRNAVVEGTGNNRVVLSYYPIGFLVSFGGEPKNCCSLKFTKINKPLL